MIPNEDFDALREVLVLYKDIRYIEDVESLKKSKDIFGDYYIAIPVKYIERNYFLKKKIKKLMNFKKQSFLLPLKQIVNI